MTVQYARPLFVLLVLLMAALATAQDLTWAACDPTTVPAQVKYPVECSDFSVCKLHGSCEQSDQIKLIVRRIRATSTALFDFWVIPGGPGESHIESLSVAAGFFELFGGQANILTIDHRGLADNYPLACTVEYATVISPLTIKRCSDSLKQNKINLNLFSTTNVAQDYTDFIETFGHANTYVLGVSYGTVVAQRMMHFHKSNIKGYILDGVAVSTNPTLPVTFSEWEVHFSVVAQRFYSRYAPEALTACPTCFPDGLKTELNNLMTRLENNDPKLAECSAILQETMPTHDSFDTKPSVALRKLLGAMVMQPYVLRPLVMPLVYRIGRCNSEDITALTTVKLHFQVSTTNSTQVLNILAPLVKFSEMWEQTPPSLQTMQSRLVNGFITSGAGYDLYYSYCAFSRDTSDACAGLEYATESYDPIMYKRDPLTNKPANPEGAAVLILNGELDFQTPFEYGKELHKQLRAAGVPTEMVSFAHTGHAQIMTSCGPTVVKQFLEQMIESGSVQSAFDLSCIDTTPFVPDATVSQSFFGTTDAYGILTTSSTLVSNVAESHAFSDPTSVGIICMCALVVVAAIAVVYKKRTRIAVAKPELGEAPLSPTRTSPNQSVEIDADDQECAQECSLNEPQSNLQVVILDGLASG